MIENITHHGQDAMLLKCDQCNHYVSIDMFDVLVAESNVHCPICGAGPDHLTYKEFEQRNEA